MASTIQDLFFGNQTRSYQLLQGLCYRSHTRTQIACRACRRRKVRCAGQNLNGQCSNCQKSGKECVYTSAIYDRQAFVPIRDSLPQGVLHDNNYLSSHFTKYSIYDQVPAERRSVQSPNTTIQPPARPLDQGSAVQRVNPSISDPNMSHDGKVRTYRSSYFLMPNLPPNRSTSDIDRNMLRRLDRTGF